MVNKKTLRYQKIFLTLLISLKDKNICKKLASKNEKFNIDINIDIQLLEYKKD